jgi:lactobin A/cerein 7B family class IIb bacteriocin
MQANKIFTYFLNRKIKMQELNLQEIEEVSGGLSPIQNVGLGLALGAFAFGAAAFVVPAGVIAAGFGIFSGGLGALSGAAFAIPSGGGGGGGRKLDEQYAAN